jgi:hypothetical protein
VEEAYGMDWYHCDRFRNPVRRPWSAGVVGAEHSRGEVLHETWCTRSNIEEI